MRPSKEYLFTRYVLSVKESGDPPDRQAFFRVLKALRLCLKREIQRRGLWQYPPTFLGIFGWRQWVEAGVSPPQEDALAELTFDCYVYIFLDRLRSLRAQLRVKPNIDGLVVLNIRHFLLERQRLADPLGARLFRTLRAALRSSIETGDLILLAGNANVGPNTVLTFSTPAADSCPPPITAEDLLCAVSAWLPTAMPDLVTAMGVAQRRIIQVLANRVLDLRCLGESFRFADLNRSLIGAVRQHWLSILRDTIGERSGTGISRETSRTLFRQLQPDTRFEDLQSFRALDRCILNRIEVRLCRHRTLEYLLRLWGFCRAYAADQPETDASTNSKDGAQQQGLPSARKLARLLRVPRDRVPGLLEVLRELVSQCCRQLAHPPRSKGTT